MSRPAAIVSAAKKPAQYDMYYANRELRKLIYQDNVYAPLDAIFNQAATENQKGDYYLGLIKDTPGNESVYLYGSAIRAFFRCQAYTRQVFGSLVPPASKPSDLNFGEWFGGWGEWESYPSISGKRVKIRKSGIMKGEKECTNSCRNHQLNRTSLGMEAVAPKLL
jgi:hypothetical protein